MRAAIKVFGIPEALQAMRHLPVNLQNRHLRIGMNAAGGVLKRSAESYVPTETRLLRRSLAVKVKIPNASYNAQHHGKPAYAVVGPKRDYVRAAVFKGSGKRRLMSDKKALQHVLGGGKVQTRNPARYAHLVHGGTKAHTVSARNARMLSNHGQVFGKSVTIAARPNPFLSKAVAQSGSAAQEACVAKLQSGLVEEAKKLYTPTPSYLGVAMAPA